MKAVVKKTLWCNENVNRGTEYTGNCSIHRYLQAVATQQSQT